MFSYTAAAAVSIKRAGKMKIIKKLVSKFLTKISFSRSIWILREKELLQEISGMGELGGQWRNIQMELLDKHLKLLKDYSQAKQNLQQCTNGKFFKQSSAKNDESLEFVPINLHLQRMWAHNDTLKR